MTWRGGAAAFVAVLAACGPQTDGTQAPSSAVENTCTATSDCGPNGSCTAGSVLVGESPRYACWSKTYDLDDLVFVVAPAALSGWSPGATYVVRNLATPTFQRNELPAIELPPLVNAQIQTVRVGMATGASCNWNLTQQNTIAASATLRSHDLAPGLPSPVYQTSTVDALGNLLVTIAPGVYDLYVEPHEPPQLDPSKAPPPACPIPPLLVRKVDAGSTRPFLARFPATFTMQGKVLLPPGFDMSGWRVVLIDGATGLRISTIGGVGANVNGVASFGRVGDDGTIVGPLEYYGPTTPPGVTDDTHSHLWLRFEPPSGVVAPTFAFVDDVFLTPGEAMMPTLDLSMLALAPAQEVIGRIEVAGTATGMAGTVWLASEPGGLKGVPPAIVAGFQVLASSDDASGDVGRIDVTLLPGSYRGLAVGRDATLGVTSFSWEIPSQATPVSGLVVDLDAQSRQSVRVTTPSGVGASNLPISFAPAPVRGETFDAVLGTRPFSVRNGDAITTASGETTLAIDAGRYELSVRPEPSSGFPWTIRPDVQVGADALSVPLTLPIELHGRIVERTGAMVPPALSSGSLQVYALAPAVTSDTGVTIVPAHYVLVADTKIAPRDGSDFNYSVLIPAHL